MNETFGQILKLISYDPDRPLIFTDGFFLFLFLVFLLVYNALKKRDVARILFVVLFSLYFYYKTSGVFVLLLIGVALSDFVIAKFIDMAKSRQFQKWLLALSCCINLGLLCYFKYTNFFGMAVSELTGWHFEVKDIFLPIGISFYIFQSMSYVIDIYRGNLKPLRLFSDYMFYVSFFPQLVAGPIVRATDFLPQIFRKPIVTKEMFGEGLFLIMTGLFKKAVISDYISLNFVDRVFDNPLLYSGFENLMGVWGYALQIYCDFSGYSDMAIGLALLLGFRFNRNFDSPYQSATITEFWRRWHISLSSWLRDYLYISLGGNRKGRVRTYVNLMITMLLGGLWHGASWQFIVWGALHGGALCVHKLAMKLFPSMQPCGEKMVWWRRVIGVFVTFNFVCLGWILFRAESIDKVWFMIERIFTNFGWEVIPQFISGYKWTVVMILLGYALHAVPDSLQQKAINFTIRSSMVYKVVATVILIWIVMQLKSSELQPFIYFQF